MSVSWFIQINVVGYKNKARLANDSTPDKKGAGEQLYNKQ